MPRIWIPLFWTALLFALVMALLPMPPRLPGATSDKVQHIIAFAVLAAMACRAYPPADVFKLALALSAFGALIEVAQAIPALHRDTDPRDWLADTAAATMVLMFVSWVRGRRRGRVEDAVSREKSPLPKPARFSLRAAKAAMRQTDRPTR